MRLVVHPCCREGREWVGPSALWLLVRGAACVSGQQGAVVPTKRNVVTAWSPRVTRVARGMESACTLVAPAEGFGVLRPGPRHPPSVGNPGISNYPHTGPAIAPITPQGGASRADRASTYEAVLDFILSTLITPRTVSAILHAAKKLVSASVNGSAAAAASASGAAVPEPPPQGDSDSQHGLALLSTALRAVETCLQVLTEHGLIGGQLLRSTESCYELHLALIALHWWLQHCLHLCRHTCLAWPLQLLGRCRCS